MILSMVGGRAGNKSRLRYSDAEYFNLSGKDARVANARREKPVPTVEQIHHVIAGMPFNSDIEQRNRALIAFTLLTGARDSAFASRKLKHVDMLGGGVFQDAREVRTKRSGPRFLDSSIRECSAYHSGNPLSRRILNTDRIGCYVLKSLMLGFRNIK